jgi:hypothetical protein
VSHLGDRPFAFDDPVEARQRLRPVHPVEGPTDHRQAERAKFGADLTRYTQVVIVVT